MPKFKQLKVVLSGKLKQDFIPNYLTINYKQEDHTIFMGPEHVKQESEWFTTLTYRKSDCSCILDSEKLCKSKVKLMSGGDDKYLIEYAQVIFHLGHGTLILPVEVTA